MSWPFYRETVTVMDVLESGACFDGVVSWIEQHGGVIAGRSAEHQEEEIAKAAFADGYGDGCVGYGDGDGYDGGGGYGDGYGYGGGNGED